jgi:hypothetical protein
MSAFVFTGPSLPPELIPEEDLMVRCLPPVSQGDVYRATLENPRVIGIIDGYFHTTRSVWHKEILWALSQGISVYGSASMGALRAAELDSFGMIGIGWVYEAFRDGSLIDDDEVAVQHGPAEVGYHCTSEAMVNIRRTLHAAECNGVISNATRLRLELKAKALYYPERSYSRIMAEVTNDVSAVQITDLSNWLPSGKINQKRIDAELMLAEMKKTTALPAPARPVNFIFEHTETWDELIREQH